MLLREEPHVVILGAGFGGLAAARALGSKPVRVTVIDRTNHHLFQPLLYQVATAALSAPDIAAPIRKLLRQHRNVTVLLGEVVAIDPGESRVRLSDGGVIAYDWLIVATGMTHAYFGHDEWAAHAPGLKTLGEALGIRAQILTAFEMAEREPDPEARHAWTTFVVIGGGPTGVELAGALAEIAGRTLARDFRHFDPTKTRVVLLEGGPRILGTFAEESSARAEAQLARLGVEVRTGALVTAVEDRAVWIGQERIDARTTLWAAGVRASPLTAGLGAPLDRAGRVKVEPDLSVPGHPEIFVLGDLIAKEQDGKPLPGVCQLGLQSGRATADNVLRAIRGRERLPFRYEDKGSMATIGRAKAVAEIGTRVRTSGFVAWLLWLFVHVVFLVEFRNRIAVLFEWAYAYLTWQRSSRVILEVPEAGERPARTSIPEIARPPAIARPAPPS
jgi:NADH dehydrogenase